MSALLPVVRSLFALASSGATGVFRIHHHGHPGAGPTPGKAPGAGPGPVSRLELEQGFVHAMSNMGPNPRGPLGEDTLVELLARLPETAETSFESRVPRSTLLGQAVTAFNPARALRRHVDSEMRGAVPPSDEARVELRYRPHASCISGVEAQVVALLASPRLFGELARASARPIAERLIGFLAAAGAVAVDDPALVEAWAALGLPVGASIEDIKRAWRQLARELHPDLHGSAAGAGEREARFHAVSAAYKRLLPGG